MAPTEYSLSQAFKRIEDELIKSMIRNFEKHKADELEEGFNWDQWQVVQLRELEKYRRKNAEKFDEEFTDLNDQIEELLRLTNEDAQTSEEAKILEQILKGNFERSSEPGIDAGMFGINEEKLNALIESTTNDLDKAERAVLRQSNDIYRKVIYDAQVYAANGGTYEQAIDMATKDFCRRGITSIVYKNGSRHTIQDYASMAIKTATKRAYLLGEGKKHAEYGIHTIRVAKRKDACPLCLRWTGKVLIDDVYGGGTKEEARQKRLPLLSTAMDKGFLHPNCKDIYSLYIEGVSKPAEPWSEYELRVLADKYNQEEGIKHAKDMVQVWQRVADTRLDPVNKQEAEARVQEWANKVLEKQFKVSEEKNHWFQSGIAGQYNKRDANVYEYKGIRIIVPKDVDPEKLTTTPVEVATALDDITEFIRPFVPPRIELVDYENSADDIWREIYDDFSVSDATYSPGADTITFYSSSPHSLETLMDAITHETGHRIDNLIALNEDFENFSESDVWQKAMELDKQEKGWDSPTNYGKNSPREDFAETVSVFARELAMMYNRFPNRLKVLTEILKELESWDLR